MTKHCSSLGEPAQQSEPNWSYLGPIWATMSEPYGQPTWDHQNFAPGRHMGDIWAVQTNIM